MLSLLSGLIAGSIHVLTGPDHLAALMPIAARSPRQARALGATWGVGHGGGILFWLLLASLGRSLFASSVISEAAELLVGLSLIALGLYTLTVKQSHYNHGHHHGAALGLGILHGTAGAGHLLGVLPTLGLEALGVLTYGAGYFLAGLLAMAAFGAGLGAWVGSLDPDAQRISQVRALASLLATGVGCAWVFYSLARTLPF